MIDILALSSGLPFLYRRHPLALAALHRSRETAARNTPARRGTLSRTAAFRKRRTLWRAVVRAAAGSAPATAVRVRLGLGGRYDDRNPTGSYRLETRILEHKVSVCMYVCLFVLAAEPVV